MSSKTVTKVISRKRPIFESQIECIVGIGASAGGLQALIAFIKAIDPKAAIAYVIIQHLTPGYRSQTAEILRQYSALPIEEIIDGLEIQAGHIYTCPVSKEVSLKNNRFILDTRNTAQSVHLPIDHFFSSLAINSKNRAVGIILSGTGTDGALGLKCLVKNDGIAIVQEPGTADFDGMPRSAISTDVVTQVMKIEDMHTVLAANLDHLLNFSIKLSQKQMINDSDVQEIIQIIKNKRVYDFSGYKRSTFIRRAMRRISLNNLASARAYIKLLKKDPAEVDRLFKDLLIGVTEFYRDPEAWETLSNDVISPLIAQKSKDEPIRIWIPGCSTGEEAYSMAMLVTDKVRRARKNCPVQIFATDTNKDALEIARLGTYPSGIVERIPAMQLKRYFTNNKNKNNYTINKNLRSAVVFGVQNLFADPPFGNVDLISCRNVLIYLDAKLQRKIINFFHFALSNKGVLFLGSAESIGNNDKLFSAISNRWRIFKKTGNTKAELGLVSKSAKVPAKSTSGNYLNISESTQISSIAQKLLLDRFTPASVLVNDNYEALYFSGEVDEFLLRPRGTPTLALLTMVKEGLRLKLRNALEEAAAKKLTVNAISARINENGQILPVKITVTPHFGSEFGRLFLVVFELELKKLAGTMVRPTQNILIRQLEEDLHATRDDLRETVLQFEAATEHLKASNEQVVTNNEELRSLNEELESSKEELQSLNEELSTSNQQLEVKIRELQVTNNDLHNLLNSNDIATICLDQSLKIKWFAPATQKQFNFILSDIGRPIHDLISAIGDHNLVNAAHDVINQKRATDFEFQVGNGRWYVRRVLPYKLDEKKTKGVIVTYTDITDVHLANEAARESRRDLDDSNEKQEQKKVLLTALALAEEKERKTLAKYLHDDLGQIFAVISLKANAVKKLASTEELRSSLDDCMTAITHANEKLREMAFQLNPPMFEKIEFVTALRWMADEMHRIYNLNVEIDDDGYPKYLEHAMSATVFRATRELLTNVSKHAQVEKAKVTLRRKNRDLLTLTVSDAGAGFDQTILPTDEHREKLGLISIRERMNILGASISIYTNPGDGTSVELSIPLIPAPQDSGMQNPGNAL